MSGKTAWGVLPAGLRAALAIAFVVAGCVAPPAGVAGAAEPQLPHLVADPPSEVSLETSTTEGGLKKEAEAQLLLRFDGYVHNKGPGALDMRGRREEPKVSQKTKEEVQRAKEKQEGLPQKTEEELAKPPMQAFQRLFTTPVGTEETNIERAHVDETSSGELIYVSADGHHHWHLQRVARYSLWNAAKTAEVAPAQKVGFCLGDSEHVETKIGPSTAVYTEGAGRAFCQHYNPAATSLFEGISPGWRDVYSRKLAFQWVDASNVLPGEYWLREDVNTLGFIKETSGGSAPAYATSPTIIPGFDALAQAVHTKAGEATTVTLTSTAWNDAATPKYAIVSQPQHGTLEAGTSSNQVIYRPASGYSGLDSFTFSASDPNSPFPRHPSIATVSIEITSSVARVLLAGDATTTYTVGDGTSGGREEAFQFIAKASGTVEELQFRTDGVANTGLTGLSLGVFADNGGRPGEVLGQATVPGQPGTSSWIKAAGLSTPVVAGTKYWLVALPLGASSHYLHYDVAAEVGAGTGNVESTAGGLTTLTAGSSWESFDQGPVGFQAIGTTGSQPSVTIEGAPASMTAGASVQLTAYVVNDSPTVTWKASAGSITAGGLYTATSAPPAGGSAVVTATTSKGAQASVAIEIVPAGPRVLLAGDATTSYTVEHGTSGGREEAFQFTAKSSGTVEELQFRSSGVANTGLTGLSLGVFTDNAGKPGEVLGQATAPGQPATSAWIKAGGLSISVVGGTKYWLVALPLGEASTTLHYNVAAAAGAGTGNVESTAGGLTALTAESSWEAFNQGPVGFQAIGTSSAPSVTIEGAPATMEVGTSVQLTAHVLNDSPTVTWQASSGSITTGGLYTAPSEPPAGGTATVTATTSKGAQATASIKIVPAGSRVLLAGDATTTYTVGDGTSGGREEAFQFTAKSSGTVEELQFRTNGVANAGVTGLSLGVFTDNAGKPGEVLGQARAPGRPGTDSWIKASGLSISVVSGTKYWLVALPLGASSANLHYNVAAAVGAGTGNLESRVGGLTALTAESSWVTFNQGPVGFQAIGVLAGVARAATPSRTASTAPTATQSTGSQPSLVIEGVPSSMIAGTSIQLSALLTNGALPVTWRVSAGSVAPSGLYTAPSSVPRGGIVELEAVAGGARDQRRMRITPVPSSQPAPSAPLTPQPGGSLPSPAVATPQAVWMDGKLIMTTVLGEAGTAHLSAYRGNRRVGSCVTQTPANRAFTCRLNLARPSRGAPISVLASLRTDGNVLQSARAATSVAPMTMPAPAGVSWLRDANGPSPWQFTCGPRLAGDALLSASA